MIIMCRMLTDNIKIKFEVFILRQYIGCQLIVEEPVFKNVKNKHLGMSPF